MFDIQPCQKRDATLYTSLPPRIVRTVAGQDVSDAYQRACIRSWTKQGFNVVSLNSRAEIDVLEKIHSDITFQEVAGARPRIVDFVDAIRRSDNAFAGIINADCLLLGNESVVQLLLRGARNGLVLAERFNLRPKDGQVTGISCSGFDFVFMHRDSIAVFEFDDRITLGTPWWDYWFPLAFQQAGGKLFIPAAPILLHLDHPQNWSSENWFLQGRRTYAGLSKAAETAKFSLPFVRSPGGAELSDEEVHAFFVDSFSWLKKMSTPLEAEDHADLLLFSFLSALDRVPRELTDKETQIRQLSVEIASIETNLRRTEESLSDLKEPSADTNGARTASDLLSSERRFQVGESVNGTVAVVIPSRLEKGADGKPFLIRAIAAGHAQVASENVRLHFYIGVDSDAVVPAELQASPNVTFVYSHGRGQAAAVNAAADAAAAQDHDFIAFLEDDDRWEPNFLSWSLSALDDCDFVSSNQLEVDAEDRWLRVNDFPTPSGWIMTIALWRKVGPFDESLRWHVDNDWLGRLALSGARRVHLVESTAPASLQNCAQVRPWIANVLTQGGPSSAALRHLSARPLVRRMVH
jgi:hypothetical protein